MSTPPLLLAAAALFWGWQTGQWAVALAAGTLLEAPHLLSRRWNLGNAEFNRVSDFCTVLVAALAVYFYFAFGNPRAITLLFQWLPIMLLPLALAQAWSTSRALDLSVLFWALRRQRLRRPATLDLSWPCFALWLLAASAANLRSNGFYAGLVALSTWAMWAHRPRSYPVAVWAGVLAIAAAGGYAGQLGLNQAQQWLEGAAPEWLAGGGSRTNPYRATTDIGTMGELKESDAIVLRVERAEGFRAPILLHRASYDAYVGHTWIARNGRFEGVDPEPPASWRIRAGSPSRRLVVHDFSPAGNPVLSLPLGTARVEGLSALGARINALGALQAERPPGFFDYEALVDADHPVESSPSDFDLRIPAAEAKTVRKVAEELQLEKLAPAQALAAVKAFFASQFSYSLYQAGSQDLPTPLADFLLSTRAGHCEYFATATVLLLRAAGIPARYATGFSVQEFSALERAYLVRERHAHAWTRAWIDGRWIEVDTTPPSWVAVEGSRAPFWQPLRDGASWLRFAASQWLSRMSDEQAQRWGIALGLVLFAYIAWRVLRNREATKAGREHAGAEQRPAQGRDSEFYGVERRVTELGWRREPAETLGEWLARLASEPQLEPETLRRLARLHSRHRFDPLGLDPGERGALQVESVAWLARHPSS